MKDIMLLLRQRKGLYLSLLGITGVASVLGTAFAQREGTTLGDTYTMVSMLMFWIMAMVAFVITPKSEKEFFESLPVKKMAVELYPYVGFLAIAFVDILLAVITSEIVGGTNVGIAGLARGEFVCLCVALLASVTLTYLCTGLFKEPVWGVFASIGIWFAVMAAIGFFEEGAVVISLTMGTAILAAAVVVMVLLMVLHAHYRELSGGRLGYFRITDVVAMFAVTFVIFSLIDLVFQSMIWALLITVAADVVVYYEVFYKRNTLKKVEIKAYAQKKNPWFFFHFPMWLGTMVVILLLVLGVSVRDHMVLNQMLKEFVDIAGAEEVPALWSEFEEVLFLDFILPVFAIGLLSSYGLIRYLRESKKETREFLERLPLSRKKRYTTMVGMDLLLVTIPVLCSIIAYAGCYCSYQKRYDVVLLAPLKEDIVWSLTVFCYAVAVMGLLYLVDAVTVGELKAFNYSIVIMTVAVLMSIVEGVFKIQFGQGVKIWMAILALLIGILLIVWSGHLYVRREHSCNYFYYKPAMHVFAILYAAAFAFFVIMLAQHIFWYVVAVAGAIMIYLGSVKACLQPKGSNGEKKVLKIATK